MRTSDKGMEFIKGWERRRLVSYQDLRGIWTIGWGHTGKDVTPGLIITRERADSLFDIDLIAAENVIADFVDIALAQNEYDALVSFVYNIGRGRFAGSTLLDQLNRGNRTQAVSELLRWHYCDKKDVEGLVRRRKAEADMFTGRN